MAVNEFKFSLHLLNRSSQPLSIVVKLDIEYKKVFHSPDKTTFVLIINEIEGIGCPNFSDVFDVLLQSHLYQC